MRHWKRVVAVLLVAAVALVVEGWAARAQAAQTLFKNCAYVRTPGESGRPPYSLAPTLGLVKVTVRTNRGDLVLTLDRSAAPCAVHSFTYLALKRFYNQTPCPRHTRAILECGVGRPGYHFSPELTGHETYPRGTVALSDTPGVGNTSAFVILPLDATLPRTSTTIGKLTAGLAVLDRLTADPDQPARILEVLIG
ncbi:peptidylprolyl isomerase [Kribbella sp. NBC_00709]|uniref:peptidylprolyl isomerase n=1 Tax=Kribbella sp. NBC_00709 TaxID=2975972 RepID=UPI002E2A4FFB|nr:peptidylprolyl isomerase [Kribbella sp. NBC_00709]